MPKKTVLIIGAGWSGIYALKNCLEAGLDARIVEASSYALGIWHYTKLPGGVLRNTHATSSKYHMSPTDFPFPDDTPIFPHHNLVEEHLHNYMDHFNLHDHILYKHKVVRVKKVGDTWCVEFEKQKPLSVDFVIVATGLNQVPSIPDDDVYKKFTGESFHAHFFQEHHDIKNKNVLVVGGGETACDIAHILSADNTVHLSIRNGVWFQSSIMGATGPADIYQNWLLMHSPFRYYGTEIFVKETEMWWGDGGSGVEGWEPGCKLLNGFYNKSRDVIMDDISKGEILPQRGVCDISGNQVRFEGDSEVHKIDTIIFGTGYNYKQALSYLPKDIVASDRYKYIFPPSDPSIAFVGFARPFVGSIPMVAEMQSRVVAQYFKQAISLPSAEKMISVIKKDKRFQKKTFPTNYVRMPFLVDPTHCGQQLAKMIGAQPRFITLFLRRPIFTIKLLIGPITPFHYRLHDENVQMQEIAYREINQVHKNPVAKKIMRRTCRVVIKLALFILLLVWLAVF